MKATRHAKILELIQSHTVTTQEEMQSLLEGSGFFTTQATISRDIRELRLVKVLSPSGIYYYTQNSAAPADTLQLSGDSVFMRSIRSVDFAGNIVVIKTHSAMASAVCEAVDNSNRPEILGTIAGENTIFVLLKTEHFADEFCTHLRELMKKNLSR